MSQLTHEEKVAITTQAMEASRQGDREKYLEIMKPIPMAAWLALAVKEVFGAEYLEGRNLTRAEAEYGKDWLSK